MNNKKRKKKKKMGKCVLICGKEAYQSHGELLCHIISGRWHQSLFLSVYPAFITELDCKKGYIHYILYLPATTTRTFTFPRKELCPIFFPFSSDHRPSTEGMKTKPGKWRTVAKNSAHEKLRENSELKNNTTVNKCVHFFIIYSPSLIGTISCQPGTLLTQQS
jgi:hypothetical protein